MGLVEKDKNAELLKKLDASVFERTLQGFFSASLIFSFLVFLPEIPQIISNFQLYLPSLTVLARVGHIFILQALIFYLNSMTNDEYQKQKENLLTKYNLKTGRFKILFIEEDQ